MTQKVEEEPSYWDWLLLYSAMFRAERQQTDEQLDKAA